MTTIITALVIANYLDRANMSVAVPLIEKDLHLSHTTMGFILSAFVWPYAIMNLPSGWAIDRFGTKILVTIAAIAWSVIAALTGFAHSVGTFLGLRVGLGISEAPLFPAALKATNSWFPDFEKGKATSVYLAATQLGLAIAAPIATVLMQAFGWGKMFFIMGLIGLIAVVAWVAVYREPDEHPWLSEEERNYIQTGQMSHGETQAKAKEKIRIDEWLSLFKYQSTWAISCGAFCLQYVFWFYISWLPSYLEKAHGFSLKQTGHLASMPFLAGTIAVLIGGRISDGLIIRGMQPFSARRYVMAIGALLTAVCMFATAYSHGAVLAMVFLTLGMFTYSLTSASHWALAIDMMHSERFVASMGSIQNFGGFLGGACAPIVTGIVVDRFGGFRIAIMVAGFSVLVTAVMYGLVLRRRLPI
jgi:MFS family permease